MPFGNAQYSPATGKAECQHGELECVGCVCVCVFACSPLLGLPAVERRGESHKFGLPFMRSAWPRHRRMMHFVRPCTHRCLPHLCVQQLLGAVCDRAQPGDRRLVPVLLLPRGCGCGGRHEAAHREVSVCLDTKCCVVASFFQPCGGWWVVGGGGYHGSSRAGSGVWLSLLSSSSSSRLRTSSPLVVAPLACAAAQAAALLCASVSSSGSLRSESAPCCDM